MYEEHSGFGNKGLTSDLEELSFYKNEEVDERVKELERENSILKIKNKDELNTKIL